MLATIVRLLDTTYVRIGNEEYARANRSFGLTTLRNRHAAVKGSRLHLRFTGKSGKEHEIALEDPRVARVVRRCQAMPGQELFQYQDEDGEHCLLFASHWTHAVQFGGGHACGVRRMLYPGRINLQQ